jgi:hypothetical protein
VLTPTALASECTLYSGASAGVEAAAEVAEMSAHATLLRQELSIRNSTYATLRDLAHVSTYGAMPIVVYEPYADGDRHGNFLDASYRAILRNSEWKCRLKKIHAQAKQSLPRAERRWKELDSCMSSDALLMNVFCHPRTLRSARVCSMLGVELGCEPKFGFPARVPLIGDRTDRTEVDMRLDSLLVEAKLTESDFQTKTVEFVESYRNFENVFSRQQLPRVGGRYASYQLIRNVLAAHALNAAFCVLLDARRPDLIDAWYAIIRSVNSPDLKTRCKVLTWQELSGVLPTSLQRFLALKYGIVGR